MGKLDEKVAIVTGSGQGLGKAYAIALAKEGASVVVVDLNEESAQSTAKKIADNNGKAIAITCDVGNTEQIDNVVKKTIEEFNTVHILVNNAQGVVVNTPLNELTVDDMEFTWRTGPLATFYFMKSCFPYLKENEGNIINVFSSAGINGNEGMGAYVSAKEAIRGLTRNAAREWGQFNINVNVIGPAAMTEPFKKWAEENPDTYQAILEKVPMKRQGIPETDLAPVIVFLASKDSKFITGQTIMIDGGETFVV